MDSLFPFLQGLAPLQHVGLSRRTEDDRRCGRYFGVMSSLTTTRSSQSLSGFARAARPRCSMDAS